MVLLFLEFSVFKAFFYTTVRDARVVTDEVKSRNSLDMFDLARPSLVGLGLAPWRHGVDQFAMRTKAVFFPVLLHDNMQWPSQDHQYLKAGCYSTPSLSACSFTYSTRPHILLVEKHSKHDQQPGQVLGQRASNPSFYESFVASEKAEADRSSIL